MEIPFYKAIFDAFGRACTTRAGLKE